MDRSFLVLAALEYIQERVEPCLVDVSAPGAQYLMDLHYPTKWAGFVADTLAAEKTC